MILRRLLSALLITLLIPSLASATLPSDSTWEVRTTGSDNNGGCYDTGGSGTDYTQQDAAQLSLSDLATSGAGSTTLTSATGGFTSAMVDNCIQITAGTNFQTGFYEITAHTDTNTVTLDRTPSSGGAGSSGTGAVGGGLATLDKVDGFVAAGHDIYIKAGTYQNAAGAAASVLAVATAGGNGTPIQWFGYNATRGDDPTGNNRPLIDANSDETYGIQITAAGNEFHHLRVANATSTGIADSSSDNTNKSFFFNVRSYSNVYGLGAALNGIRLDCVNLELDTNTADGTRYWTNTDLGTVYNCYSHDNTGSGINARRMEECVINSVFSDNGGDGITASGELDSFQIITHSIFDNNTGDGIDMAESAENEAWQYAMNNIFTDNGGYGFSISGTDVTVSGVGYNVVYNNTSGAYENITAFRGDQTGNPNFTDAANEDYTINLSSSATGNGFDLSDWSGMTGPLDINMGIDQDDNTVGGGGSASSYTWVQ